MTETISYISIAGMALTLCISVVTPVAALIILYKKTHAKPINALIGAGTFIVFALILEQILHLIMMSVFKEALTGNIWLTALYGGLAAGLFEETGRLLSMKLLMKKSLSRENAVMFGIGHGGAESIILIGLTYVSNIATAVMINAGMLDSVLSGVDEALRAQTMEQLSALWLTPSYQFFLAGIERMGAMALHICLSYIVYRAVCGKKPALYLLAVALHFIIDAGIVLLSRAIPLYLVECIFIAAVICLAVGIILWDKRKAPAAADDDNA